MYFLFNLTKIYFQANMSKVKLETGASPLHDPSSTSMLDKVKS